ncbi:uncharacterized protein RAG0_02928 [Rhynchosporium agropyri]|uniref:Uncharacterized protein n=1 Tax=Rhynchosporium agropyri TaxID=914238 RepID=A0A1E1K3I2_9HELO|nr:uncharacterized protein RAG0_02928 [Rhynchosporium agropyri]
MTIGNIDANTRRNPKAGAIILCGFLPIGSSKDEPIIKAELYHRSMQIFTYEMEAMTKEGVWMRCSDGYIRKCFPVIAGMCIDYPEQCLVTGVKNGPHCPRCEVRPEHRENLIWDDETQKPEHRTPWNTTQRILDQRELRKRAERARNSLSPSAGKRDEEMDVHEWLDDEVDRVDRKYDGKGVTKTVFQQLEAALKDIEADAADAGGTRGRSEIRAREKSSKKPASSKKVDEVGRQDKRPVKKVVRVEALDKQMRNVPPMEG